MRRCWRSGPEKKIAGNSAFDLHWASRWDDHLRLSSETSGRPCGMTRQQQSTADKERLKERLFYSSPEPFCSWKPRTASVGGGFVECRSDWFWKTVSAAEWKQQIFGIYFGQISEQSRSTCRVFSHVWIWETWWCLTSWNKAPFVWIWVQRRMIPAPEYCPDWLQVTSQWERGFFLFVSVKLVFWQNKISILSSKKKDTCSHLSPTRQWVSN